MPGQVVARGRRSRRTGCSGDLDAHRSQPTRPAAQQASATARAAQQRQVHRVGAVHVRPQLDVGAGPASASRPPGDRRDDVARVEPLDVVAARAGRPRRPAGSRPGAASRSRRRRRRPGRTASQRRDAAGRAAAARAPARSAGVRRQRASGRRRSAPSPVHGRVDQHPVVRARLLGADLRPSPVRAPRPPRPGHRAQRPARPGAARLDRYQPGAARQDRRASRGADGASSAALPPGPGAQVEPARRPAPSSGACASGRARPAGCPRPAPRPGPRARPARRRGARSAGRPIGDADRAAAPRGHAAPRCRRGRAARRG